MLKKERKKGETVWKISVSGEGVIKSEDFCVCVDKIDKDWVSYYLISCVLE